MLMEKELTFSLAQRWRVSVAGMGEGFLEEAGMGCRDYRSGKWRWVAT